MKYLEKIWYGKAGGVGGLGSLLLLPLAWLFRAVAVRRRRRYLEARRQIKERPAEITAPVIVVGNITAGGTGKTPLLMALAEHLKRRDLQPGVLSRGYGGKAPRYPLLVDIEQGMLPSVRQCGDEAMMIAENTGCPVAVAPARQAALQFMLKSRPDVTVVLSDDGLQHYRLWRDLEIAVVDGARLLGNGRCLPAGPLREPPSRLSEVDFIVVNGANGEMPGSVPAAAPMEMVPRAFVNLLSGERRSFKAAPFKMGQRLQAVAGIGNPERFFATLESVLPYELRRFPFPDHHPFTFEDLERAGLDRRHPVVMTEKDAVKCRRFARSNYWALAAEAVLPDAFLNDFGDKVAALRDSIPLPPRPEPYWDTEDHDA